MWNNDKCSCECKNLKEEKRIIKKIIFGILLYVVAKVVNIQQLLIIQRLRVMKYRYQKKFQ